MLKRIVILTVVISIFAITYKFGSDAYKSIHDKISKKVEDEIAESLVLTFTPNEIIDKLPETERKDKFQKKAKLYNRRIRIMEQLEETLSENKLKLSPQHKANLENAVAKAKILFGTIDTIHKFPFFVSNPYDKDYHNAGITDKLIEEEIIKSIIYSTKPENEYTEKEKAQKKDSAIRRKRIISKITGEVSAAFVSQIENSEFLMNLIFPIVH